jgi:hypothetical protein
VSSIIAVNSSIISCILSVPARVKSTGFISRSLLVTEMLVSFFKRILLAAEIESLQESDIVRY